MPSFSDETVEQWRRERVHETTVPNNLTHQQPAMMRATIDEDLTEERRRLAAAQAQVKESQAAIAALVTKSRALYTRYRI